MKEDKADCHFDIYIHELVDLLIDLIFSLIRPHLPIL